MEEIFLQAVELGPTERAALLRERCEGDRALMEEVSSLLASWDTPGLVPELEEERPFGGRFPKRMGAYRIVRPLGEGGMGVVFLAIREGDGFEQTVALKLLRGSFADPLLARRLAQERRILALLEHPGIARLVDGGVTPEGQPFYAMEYVLGEDILSYCDARQLILEDRLRLFIQVCEAVNHAHQQLVVHRDLKPSNILVTPEGLPKLLDFGIAKELEEVPAAEPTLHWITPAYASPEQVTSGVVTTLSDVYALGVLLCELLAGARPYSTDNRAPGELARVIGEEPPRRPSELVEGGVPDRTSAGGATPEQVAQARGSTPHRLARALRGELDLVVMKALAKEPHRRYESAAALGEDLRRFLEGRPLRARPDSRRYRVSKLVTRHKALAGAAALLVLVVAAGISGILWQAGQAARERDRAVLEATRAQQVAALMTEIFRLGDPAQSLGDTIGVRQLLDEGTRKVDETMGGDPVLQATFFLELAHIYRDLGILGKALELGTRALELREANEGETVAHADALGFQGLVLRDAGDTRRSMEVLDSAIALRERVLATPDTTLAALMVGLAWQVRAAGDYERARSLFSRAVEIQSNLLGPDAPAVAASTLGVAATFHDEGSFDKAMALLRRALARGAGAPSPMAATALVNLGMMERLREQFREAEPILRAALEMREKLYDPAHPDVVEARQELAVELMMLGRLAEADSLLRKNFDFASRSLGPEHQATRSAEEALGTVLYHQGRFDDARLHLERAMAAKVRAHGRDHPGVVYSLNALGDVMLEAGSLTEAEKRYRDALAMSVRLGNSEGVYGALSRHGLAKVALARGNVSRADSLMDAAYTTARASLREDHRYVLAMQRTRARILLARDKPGEAEAMLTAVLAVEERVRPHPHPRIGVTLILLGEARQALGDRAGTEKAWREALSELSELPPGHPDRRRLEGALATLE